MAAFLFLAACEKDQVQMETPSTPDELVTFRTTGGGNLDCADVGDYDETSGRIDRGGQCGGTVGPFEWSTDGTCTYVDWEWIAEDIAPCGFAIILKGSDAAEVYYYDDETSGSNLAPPVNSSGNPAQLSNITFCWNVCEVEDECEWCSSGYWRQEHHLDSWAATGIDPDASYNYYFNPDLTGNPTLWEVLQSPQTYGGQAFNNVGDLLSSNHPDVDYCEGERPEDTCPLN